MPKPQTLMHLALRKYGYDGLLTFLFECSDWDGYDELAADIRALLKKHAIVISRGDLPE